MMPTFKPGSLVLARVGKPLATGQIVIVIHNGYEKIKRLQHIEGNNVFIVGDNPSESTDSREFGWVPISTVRGVVIWPQTVHP